MTGLDISITKNNYTAPVVGHRYQFTKKFGVDCDTNIFFTKTNTYYFELSYVTGLLKAQLKKAFKGTYRSIILHRTGSFYSYIYKADFGTAFLNASSNVCIDLTEWPSYIWILSCLKDCLISWSDITY